MARRVAGPAPGIGSDSFTDVITNVVGILVVLVIVVGISAKDAVKQEFATDEFPPEAAARVDELKRQIAQAEIDNAAEQARRAVQAREVEELRRSLTQFSADIARRRAEVQASEAARGDRQRQQSELERQVAEALAYGTRLESDLAELDSQRPKSVVQRSYPTPVSRSVDGRETHFQLRGGRIAHIPLDELLLKLKRDAVQQINALQELPEFSDVVGPLGGFRLQYTMERIDLPPDRRTGLRGGSYAQLKEWTLIPVDGRMGETLEEALSPKSQFRSAVASLDPGNETVTFWTYPGSFEEFRSLRDVLVKRGFSVAARPLPEGRPIAGSPDGSRSAAQ